MKKISKTSHGTFSTAIFQLKDGSFLLQAYIYKPWTTHLSTKRVPGVSVRSPSVMPLVSAQAALIGLQVGEKPREATLDERIEMSEFIEALQVLLKKEADGTLQTG